MLKPAKSYEAAREGFRWEIPAHYNMGVDVADKHAAKDPASLALIDLDPAGGVAEYSFGDLRSLSNRLANVLRAKGLERGDRVAILLPQTLETVVGHIAAYKAGMIAVPLFILFGEDALEYRLQASGAKAVITNAENLPKIAAIRERLPELTLVLSIDGVEEGPEDFHGLLDAASDDFEPVATAADDPALLIFTSGTTGPPKGALHAHRVLLGHLPGVEFMHDFFPRPRDRFWTPADWAWVGGLMDVLMPALHHGITVVSYRARKFDPEEAFRLMADHEVRNAFLPPTALKLMRQVADPRERWNYALRSVFTGGETMGTELLDWGRENLGITLNEGYGQTECNLVVGNCNIAMEVRPGSMGRAIPGHDVAIVDDHGNPLADGEDGNIAVRRPDPVMMLEYWEDKAATRDKFAGDWLLTGDVGRRDEDGYFWFTSRDDDVITSAGYRIGPGEIEDCLMRHPSVALAAVIGVPDELRTEAIKAFIVPAEEAEPSDDLTAEIQEFVKTRLAMHEYPRLVEFVDELPMTTTGKIMRKDLRALEEEKRKVE
ncbi:MAG: acyl-CoA synthetase [Alphaproteobacteria bacterium]|nr:acyl-CoA synthetase [Alphaproteobacteria bacterium]